MEDIVKSIRASGAEGVDKLRISIHQVDVGVIEEIG